jgi:hypothetical protein
VLAEVLAEGGLHHFERVVGGPMHAVYTVRP